jgi:hypothetical protein
MQFTQIFFLAKPHASVSVKRSQRCCRIKLNEMIRIDALRARKIKKIINYFFLCAHGDFARNKNGRFIE